MKRIEIGLGNKITQQEAIIAGRNKVEVLTIFGRREGFGKSVRDK